MRKLTFVKCIFLMMVNMAAYNLGRSFAPKFEGLALLATGKWICRTDGQNL